METKMIKVPFNVELAKRIQNNKCEGRIVTREGRNARIICVNAHRDDNIVALIENEKGVEYPKCYASDGMAFITGESNLDLLLEIPEYITFKDGDVIAFGDNCIGIFKKQYGEKSHECYVMTSLYMKLIFYAKPLTYNNARFATEEEKQKLIDALKESKEQKAKKCLKKLGIEEKQECEFKPFDKVLVRNDDKLKWYADIFSNKDENGKYVCIGWNWKQCIPYEGNEHLLGTTENYE